MARLTTKEGYNFTLFCFDHGVPFSNLVSKIAFALETLNTPADPVLAEKWKKKHGHMKSLFFQCPPFFFTNWPGFVKSI